MSRRLPAEWEPQDAVLLGWPHAATDWHDRLATVTPVFAHIAAAISQRQMVVIPAPEPQAVQEALASTDARMERVRILPIPTNDTWARDFGPVTVYEDGNPVLLDFGFNGWGLKFACHHDNQVTARLQASGAFGLTRREVPGLVLEGGSIESDGRGRILTTAPCLLEPNRNPHLLQAQIDEALRRWLGAEEIHWLQHGYLAGDDTDSHVDTLARFAPHDTIVYVQCNDASDEHAPELQAMETELRQLRTAKGQPYRLLPLPWPDACQAEDGHRLPATYANYLVINGAVLAAVYGCPQDEAALKVLAMAYPGREIVPINCRELIEQHGSLHCVTMQLPQGVLA